jgi:hypothetical protein
MRAIAEAHQVAGHPSPRSDRLVKETWKGIRRRLGVAQQQKDPVSAKEIVGSMNGRFERPTQGDGSGVMRTSPYPGQQKLAAAPIPRGGAHERATQPRPTTTEQRLHSHMNATVH